MAQLKGPSRIKVEKLLEWAALPEIHTDNERFRRVCRSAYHAERELAETQRKLEQSQIENLAMRRAIQRAITGLDGTLEGRPDDVAHIG